MMLARKRKRTVPITVQDVLHLGRLVQREITKRIRFEIQWGYWLLNPCVPCYLDKLVVTDAVANEIGEPLSLEWNIKGLDFDNHFFQDREHDDDDGDESIFKE
jgi:hypothetical protein